MKQAIITYSGSGVLAVLKALSKVMRFSVTDSEGLSRVRKSITFKVLHVEDKDYKFHRDEANER